ncbi:MAG TPA: MerR family transcriptional regulator [Tepidiformaceae bacterium]|nr:MerR family transcriptional regulator [Tepidiformaceae bacterium]
MTDSRSPAQVFLQIGEAAERTALTQRTLRFYEEKGLLNPPTRMDGGFRLYSEEDIERIERIKQMKDLLGFSLADIKEMIDAEDVRLQIKAGWREDAAAGEKSAQILRAHELTAHQLELLDEKMKSMSEFRRTLVERLARYGDLLREYEAEAAPARR